MGFLGRVVILLMAASHMGWGLDAGQPAATAESISLTSSERELLDSLKSMLEGLTYSQCGWLFSENPRTDVVIAQLKLRETITKFTKETKTFPVDVISSDRSKLLKQLFKIHTSIDTLQPLVGKFQYYNHDLGHTISDAEYLKIAATKAKLPPEIDPAFLDAMRKGEAETLKPVVEKWNERRQKEGKPPVTLVKYVPTSGSSGSRWGDENRVFLSIPGKAIDLYVQTRPPEREVSLIAMEKHGNDSYQGWFRDSKINIDGSLSAEVTQLVNGNACRVCHQDSTPNSIHAKKILFEFPAGAHAESEKRIAQHRQKPALTPYDPAMSIVPVENQEASDLARRFKLTPESEQKVKSFSCTSCHKLDAGYGHAVMLIKNGRMPPNENLAENEREALEYTYKKNLCDSLLARLSLREHIAGLKAALGELAPTPVIGAARARTFPLGPLESHPGPSGPLLERRPFVPTLGTEIPSQE